MSDTIIESCILDVLPTLDAQSVHMVATSPPFFGLRDYGIEPSNWPAVSYAPMAGLPEVEVEAWTGCLGHEPTVSAYVGHLVAVFRLVRRVLRDDGTLWLNLGDSFANDSKWGGSTGGKHVASLHGNDSIGRQKRNTGLKAKDLMMIPARVALALQADGWFLRSEIIWAKGVSFCESYAGSSMPESVKDRPSRSHEQVFLLTKKAKYFYDHIAIQEKTTGNAHSRGSGLHPRVAPTGSGIKQNESWSSATRHLVSMRNLRSVWAINPEPSPFAHYSAWPKALVAPMIRAGTSERGVCPTCGAPWERVVDYKANYDRREPAHAPNSTPTKVDSTGWRPPDIKTTGWRPTCDCYDDLYQTYFPQSRRPKRRHAWHASRWFRRLRRRGLTQVEAACFGFNPATVLDIFAGTGTTAGVARRLGRHAILIDRSGDYVEMQHERLAQRELF